MPEEVPTQWERDADEAWWLAMSERAPRAEMVRRILVVVAPLIEQQVRERIAAELKRHAHDAAVADIHGFDGPANPVHSVQRRGYESPEARTWMAAANVVEDGSEGKPE